MDGILKSALGDFLMGIPVYLVWIIGFILAFKNRHAYPKTAAFASLGLATRVLRTLIGFVFYIGWSRFYASPKMNAALLPTITNFQNIVDTLLAIITWGLIIAAIFVERNQARANE